MGKLFKYLVILGFVCGLLFAFSYAGAKVTVGKMIGSNAVVGNRDVRFLWKGADSLPGRPRVWEYRFSRVAAIGGQPARVWVSPGGTILRTSPRDLAQRMVAAAKAKEDNP